jgi:hypothetical protein
VGGSYYQGNSVDERDAEHHGASWTADELATLRDQWRRMSLTDLAQRLGRTEGACSTQYYIQLNRPLHERWTPGRWQEAKTNRRTTQPERPYNTIHDDEDRWWEADYYRKAD